MKTSKEQLQHIFSWRNKKNGVAHIKTCNKICATSKISDQPAHLCNQIRVFADHIRLLQSSGHLKRDK